MTPIHTWKWKLYFILCDNNSLYIGVSTDPERRFEEHASGKGAKYFRRTKPVKLIWSSLEMDKSYAHSLEYHLKQETREGKLRFLKQHGITL